MLMQPACEPTIGTTSSPSEIRRSTALLLTPLKFVLPTGRTRSRANVGPTSTPSGSTACPSLFSFTTASASAFSAHPFRSAGVGGATVGGGTIGSGMRVGSGGAGWAESPGELASRTAGAVTASNRFHSPSILKRSRLSTTPVLMTRSRQSSGDSVTLPRTSSRWAARSSSATRHSVA